MSKVATFLWRWVLHLGLVALGPAALPAFAAPEPPPLSDPIADYLAMQVPDRQANAGQLWILKEVTVDVDGDGKPEVFVGTWYRKSGPNTWLWTGYTPVAGGYRRITPADADVLIDFNQIYVGPIPELHRQGMVQGYSLELDNQQRDQSNLLSDVTYYYLQGGANWWSRPPAPWTATTRNSRAATTSFSDRTGAFARRRASNPLA